jgi:hypothetical protein
VLGRISNWIFRWRTRKRSEVCLEGTYRDVPVTVEPAGARLLMRNTVRTVADILALAEWPVEQLRLVLERWHPGAEVKIERIR